VGVKKGEKIEGERQEKERNPREGMKTEKEENYKCV
jgi:hypothetical protein